MVDERVEHARGRDRVRGRGRGRHRGSDPYVDAVMTQYLDPDVDHLELCRGDLEVVAAVVHAVHVAVVDVATGERYRIPVVVGLVAHLAVLDAVPSSIGPVGVGGPCLCRRREGGQHNER